MSPAAKATTSPVTSWEMGISRGWPPRMTVAMTEIIALSFAAAWSARDSCTSFSPAPSAIMAVIIMPARTSPVAKETPASDASRITSGLSTACRMSVTTPAR